MPVMLLIAGRSYKDRGGEWEDKKRSICLHDYNNRAGFFVRFLLPISDINVYRDE